MREYTDLLKDILQYGESRTDRTGVGTIGIFGCQMRFDLSTGFPALTAKRLAWRSVVSELLWFLEGSTDERRLAEILHGSRDPRKKTIWTANVESQGRELGYTNTDNVRETGPIYGKQWRDFGGVDQIEKLISELKNNPSSRRHVLSAWNPPELDQMILPPCHVLSQYYVDNKNRLSCHLYQRSADMFLGVPFNIASYSLLVHVLARICGYGVGHFIHSIGDAHVYKNHVDAAEEMLTWSEKKLPELEIPDFVDLQDVLASSVDDFRLIGYDPHPPIKVEMAV